MKIKSPLEQKAVQPLLSVRNMVPTLISRWRLGLSLNGRC
jgi:hypothetical protein